MIATIPVGLTGIALEHTFRTLFAKPAAAAIFLLINGLVLLGAEWLRRARLRRDPHAMEAPAEVAAAAPAASASVPAAQAAGRGRPGAHARQAGGRELADIRAAQASDARIYFQTRTLTPFAIYCLAFGGLSIIHFAL